MSTFWSFRLHPRFYASVGVVVIVAVLILMRTLRADAEFAFFDSYFAERIVEVKNDEATQIPQNLHTHTWNTFAGSVPPGAMIGEVTLILTWSEATTHTDAVQAEVLIPTENGVVLGADDSEDATGREEPSLSEEIREETVVVEEALNVGEATETPEPPVSEISEETTSPVIPAGDETIEAEHAPGEEQNEEITPPPADTTDEPALEVEEVIEVLYESPEEGEGVSDAAFMHTNPLTVYSLAALAQDEEISASTESSAQAVSDSPVNEVSETFIMEEDVSETPLEVEVTELENLVDAVEEGDVAGTSTTTEISPEVENEEDEEDESLPPLYPSRETASIQYSYDGDTWIELGTVNLLTATEATFLLTLQSVDVIDTLQVRAVYLAPQDVSPIIFGNAQLKIAYEPGVIEPISLGPSDQEPNFSVSSIKADVTRGSVRAVLLERGGVFEMWGALIDRGDETATWTKFASGNAINESMPIDVKDGTVFWFDKNGQTLFAYDMHTESLTGATSPSDEEGVYSLVFGDGRRLQRVTYNALTNSLEFDSATSRVTP